jgi:rare lipoprotein A
MPRLCCERGAPTAADSYEACRIRPIGKSWRGFDTGGMVGTGSCAAARIAAGFGVCAGLLVGTAAALAAELTPTPHHTAPKARPLDLSGHKRTGQASVYAKKFAGRKMADGERMNPQDDNAASQTLPLGTRARVTNLETGQSAVVTIQDRGPHAKGRIVDLSPATANKIGISRKEGVARVEVAPIAVPQPDGSVRRGSAAR